MVPEPEKLKKTHGENKKLVFSEPEVPIKEQTRRDMVMKPLPRKLPFLKIMNMEINGLDEFIFQCEDELGHKIYRSHEYIIKGYPFELIRFYESKLMMEVNTPHTNKGTLTR